MGKGWTKSLLFSCSLGSILWFCPWIHMDWAMQRRPTEDVVSMVTWSFSLNLKNHHILASQIQSLQCKCMNTSCESSRHVFYITCCLSCNSIICWNHSWQSAKVRALCTNISEVIYPHLFTDFFHEDFSSSISTNTEILKSVCNLSENTLICIIYYRYLSFLMISHFLLSKYLSNIQ